jgi:taurine dioxygenase
MGLTADPLTANIGAEICGVDLCDNLSDDIIAEIRNALLDWKVVFFRDQHLDRGAHVAFGRRFGDLEVHPLTPPGQDHPEVFVLPSEGTFRAPDTWHSDVTWRPEPSMGSILRIVEMPPLGGDTLWADMGLAYDLLPDAVRDEIDQLVGLHDYLRAFGWMAKTTEAKDRMRAEHPIVEHPVIRTHPETKRKTLYVNGAFTCGIKGMDSDRAVKLLDHLQRQATIPDVQCRFRWGPGSVAFWDNRATQHCVSNDFLPARRVMERVTVVGDRPY